MSLDYVHHTPCTVYHLVRAIVGVAWSERRPSHVRTYTGRYVSIRIPTPHTPHSQRASPRLTLVTSNRFDLPPAACRLQRRASRFPSCSAWLTCLLACLWLFLPLCVGLRRGRTLQRAVVTQRPIPWAVAVRWEQPFSPSSAEPHVPLRTPPYSAHS